MQDLGVIAIGKIREVEVAPWKCGRQGSKMLNFCSLVVVAGRRWPPVAGYRCPLVEDQYLGVSRGAVCARKRKERCTWLSGPCWLLPPVAAAVASTREG